MAPEISILLPTRNGGELFGEVLDALLGCRGIERSEIVVIDSGSTDGTFERAEERSRRNEETGGPEIRPHRIDPATFGHGRTRNLAASMARGRLLVYLVQDATPANDSFLEELVAPLADPGVAGAYGRQVARPEASPVEAEFLRQTYPRQGARRRVAAGEATPIGAVFFSNVCSAMRRETWTRFPFDDDLLMSEDQQWARDVLAAGYEVVYRPSATVLHSHHYGFGRVFRRNFDSGCSLVGITQDSWLDMARYELRFLARAAGSLYRRGEAVSIPRLVLHEAARAAGFALGRHAHRLPRRLCRTLSLHTGYWAGDPLPERRQDQ